jgi:diaminopimelate decarboxylase
MAQKAGATARIALRVNPDVASGTHAKISTGQKETKFGIGMAQAHETYRLAASLPGIAAHGVSVHIGSQLISLEPFAHAFARVREFVLALRAEGHRIDTLDLGGGLGVPYGREDPPLPAAYAEIVRREVGMLETKLVFEPGRLLVGNAGILVARVIYVKRGEGARIFVICDAGMNDLIRPTLYEAWHDIIPIRAPEGDAPTELVDVVGPVCETGDIFAEQRLLKVPSPGDLIAFRTAGAYGAAMSGTYNARPLVAEVMVNGAQWAAIRPRQTYEELLARDVVPGWL